MTARWWRNKTTRYVVRVSPQVLVAVETWRGALPLDYEYNQSLLYAAPGMGVKVKVASHLLRGRNKEYFPTRTAVSASCEMRGGGRNVKQGVHTNVEKSEGERA